MKAISKTPAWTALLIAGLLVSGNALRGAEAKVKTQNESSSTTPSDRMLGQVEPADKVIGRQVRSSDDQKLGKIDDLIVDLESGRILYAVIGSGGVLGAGEKKIAVAPGIFEQSQGDTFRVNVDKAKFLAAPEFTREHDKADQWGKADFVKNVYSYFGQNMWWQGSRPPGEGSFNNVHKASDISGMKVHNVANAPVGKIENLAVDLPAGRVVFAVLDPDRSFDLGSNLYAIPPNALTLSPDRKNLVSDLSKEKLAAAPHFEKKSWGNLSDPAWASRVYQYYGKQAYFENSSVRPTGSEKGRIYQEKQENK